MEIVIGKIVRHGAFHHAVSHDFNKIAISSDNNIAIYSIPDLNLLTTVPVKNASSMVFLFDNCSMLILNTTGRSFLWHGSTLEKLGRWPVVKWYEAPLHYADDSCVFWGSIGGVWRYDTKNNSMKKIFSTQKDVEICKCGEGKLGLILTNSPPSDEQIIEIMELSYDGNVLGKWETKQQLKTRLINKPVWSDDLIAISSLAAPPQSKTMFDCGVSYKFTIEGRAVFEQNIEYSEDEEPLRYMMYLLNKQGNILLTQESSTSDGDLYCGNGILAKCSSDEEKVVFMQLENLRQLYVIDKPIFVNRTQTNPPTFVCFTPNNQILVGSWKKLFVFRTV